MGQEREAIVVRIAVFVSGGGSNLQSLIDACRSGYITGGKICLVFSNQQEAYGLERAAKAGIRTLCLLQKDFQGREAFDVEVAGIMNADNIELICLAGYMRVLSKAFIDTFDGKIMNIHPAILPDFGGKGMYGIYVHEAVLKAGVKETGCTVHFVDYGTDTGPVILQRRTPVLQGDTPDILRERVLAEEHKAYPEAVKLFCEGRIKINGASVTIQ